MSDEEWRALFERRLLGDHTLLGLMISDVERQQPGYCDRLRKLLDTRLGALAAGVDVDDPTPQLTAQVRSQVLMHLDQAKSHAGAYDALVPEHQPKDSLKRRFARWLLS
jgi:hypothetical protein